GVNSTERAAVAEDIFDHGSEAHKLGALADNDGFRSEDPHSLERAFEQGTPFQLEKGFVSPHAGALAAGKDEGCEIIHAAHHTPLMKAPGLGPGLVRHMKLLCTGRKEK